MSRTRDPGYSVRDFADDQLRMLAAHMPAWPARCTFVEVVDGRMVVVRERARAAAWDHADVFAEKYGTERGGRRHARFCLVLEFLRRWSREVSNAGLALDGDPSPVREEFVRFLLGYELRSGSVEIPRSAIEEFLDEWGLRWM